MKIMQAKSADVRARKDGQLIVMINVPKGFQANVLDFQLTNETYTDNAPVPLYALSTGIDAFFRGIYNMNEQVTLVHVRGGVYNGYIGYIRTFSSNTTLN